MDLNLLTIANRATLSSDIASACSNALAKITQIEALTKKVEASTEFSSIEKEQNRDFSIIGLTSLSEYFVNEVLLRLLISYPKKLGNKSFTIDELLEEGTFLEVVRKKASGRVLDLAYGKFERFIHQFTENAELTKPLDSSLISKVNEIKCTRDCVIHSNGRANDLYFEKVGQQRRVRSNGDKLDTSLSYFTESVATISKFIMDIRDSMPAKYMDSKKSYVFKQMWEATCLGRIKKFDEVWSIQDGSMVRPVDLDNDFGFSSSELVVHDLFRHMYSGSKYPVDFPLLFKKWKPQSANHQVAMSWLDNQFYF